MISNRERLILKAIIEHHSEHQQPISSKFLSNLSYLNYSSATIRYDMAQLEKKGYLCKTHISSGRIPSLKGYVFYFNHLITRNHDVLQQISLFENIFKNKNVNMETIIKEALTLLGNMTRYLVILAFPNALTNHKVAKIDVFFLTPEQAIVLIITNHGQVRYQSIFLESCNSFNFKNLQNIVYVINNILFDKYLFEAIKILQDRNIENNFCNADLFEKFINILIEIFYSFNTNNSHIYGIDNLINNFSWADSNTMKEILHILDTNKLNEMLFDAHKCIFKFNNRIRWVSCHKFAIISIPCEIKKFPDQKMFIAVLGPMTMAYPEVIPLLEYLSVNFSQTFYSKKNLIPDNCEEICK
ncbi:heat-inducible transcriptional repressor HrcA [Candidatus Phytoplasma bonamiae]|uniref:Heat-inducible transcription repressor HrcA n=1 Tax=Candidatus Phytoplasma bonamiae TaxID=2982626 RepID=A0ABT9D7Z5_9MOLU|nr:heat-inducible transcriptional repressor HrcA ['Bonamia sp.' little leaf phytoplasma]MDO8064171.1 heat-inducible transcriptional repressor HrcA ['Bonamia sp.' little leaf phytoplasma]MDV3174725.1 heat-inducible transcriptional repressor HrcA ['Bonamia sp.' little leaf phytoplasma]